MFGLLGRPKGVAAFASASAIAIVASVSSAQAQEQVRQFNIPAQSLSSALREFSRQADVMVVADGAVVNGRQAPAVEGSFTPSAALRLLLAGSGLDAAPDANGRFVLADTSSPTRLGAASESASSDQEIIVTGTRIRGVSDQFSPVTSVARDDMDLAGNATVFDAIQNLPQNFAGGPSPDTSRAGSISGAGAAGINLRGLGSEATLVLLNGRRLAPGGATGGFVDISALPVTAIDRIEILPDGASAIYGSDAIAGVVNIITRDDFEGAETRIGWSSAGGAGEIFQFGQTAGLATEASHLLLTYQYSASDELNQNDRDFARGTLPDPNYLLPFSRSHSVLASGGLELSDRVSMSADAYYNERDSRTSRGDDFGVPVITYQEIEVQQYGATAGLNIELVQGWRIETTGAYSYSHHQGVYDQEGYGNRDDAATSISAIDTSISGPLFQISADAPVQVVFGVHYREESADVISVGIPSGNVSFAADQTRSVGAVFGEVYAPLVEDGDDVFGVHRLAVTAAIRYEDYSDLGTSTDPRLGVVYAPFPSLTFRGTWGTAFRAPRLEQMRDQIYSYLGVYEDSSLPGGQAVALVIGGQQADLDPEQAETWTAGFDWRPEQLDAFQLRATYFNVDYSDRVGFPSSGLNSAFHFVDFTGPVTLNPDPATVTDIVNRSTVFFNYADFYPIGPLAVGDVTALLDQRTQNLATSTVAGLDVEATLSLEDWSLFANVTWLTDYTQQVTPGSPVLDLLNTFGNPIDLRVRAGVQWTGEALTASLAANYVDSYTDDETPGADVPVDDWLTLDAGLRLDLGRAFGGSDLALGVSLAMTVTNLLDEDPPGIGPRIQADLPYDPANADPTGRRIGFLLTKRW